MCFMFFFSTDLIEGRREGSDSIHIFQVLPNLVIMEVLGAHNRSLPCSASILPGIARSSC